MGLSERDIHVVLEWFVYAVTGYSERLGKQSEGSDHKANIYRHDSL
jgi:hypothetical protein